MEQGNIYQAIQQDGVPGATPKVPTTLVFKSGQHSFPDGSGGMTSNIDNAYGGGSQSSLVTSATPTTGDGNNSIKSILPAYICPSDIIPSQDSLGVAKSNYCGCMGDNYVPGTRTSMGFGCGQPRGNQMTGVLTLDNDNNRSWLWTMGDITDGTSNTILVGEVTRSKNVHQGNLSDGSFPTWAGGMGSNSCTTLNAGSLRFANAIYYINRNWQDEEAELTFGSQHTGGAQFLMGDGSVRFLSQNIDTLLIYPGLATRNGGEVASAP
jgi:prepilin-type processing-associated H-X9-DG protein